MNVLSRLLAATVLAVLSTTNHAAILEQTAPLPTSYLFGTDFRVMFGTHPGDVTASVTAVDIQLGLGNASTSGCEAADFAGFPAGSIALLQRGACTFNTKATNAQLAGAIGALIFNQGNTSDPTRNDAFSFSLSPFDSTIPVLFLTYPLGEALIGTTGLAMHMQITEEDLRALQPVPLPATLSLLLLGLAGLALSRRKRA